MFDPLGANTVNSNVKNISDNVLNTDNKKENPSNANASLANSASLHDSVFLKVVDFEKTKMLQKETKKIERNKQKAQKAEKNIKNLDITENNQNFEFGGLTLNDSLEGIENEYSDIDALNSKISNDSNAIIDNNNNLFNDSPISTKPLSSIINNSSTKTATVTRRTSTVASENSNDNNNVDDLKISKTLLIREDRSADADMFGTSFAANKLQGETKKLENESTQNEETTNELDSLVDAISQLESTSNKPAPKIAVITDPALASTVVADTPDVDIDINKFDIDSYINSQSEGGGLFD